MKWKRIYSESQKNVIPVEVDLREVKLIQNYLNKGKPLNDPSNKECLSTVVRILNEIVQKSNAETIDIGISNFFSDNFGIEIDLDPYGENSAVELGENGLVPIAKCSIPELCQGGEMQDLVQGGFWSSTTGELEEGFMSVDDMNLVLSEMKMQDEIKSIQLKKDGQVARILIEFD